MHRQTPIHNFAARCPRGHRPAQSHTLAELRDPELRFYCRLCGQSWRPRASDRTRALGFAEQSEAYWRASHNWIAPPPAAA